MSRAGKKSKPNKLLQEAIMFGCGLGLIAGGGLAIGAWISTKEWFFLAGGIIIIVVGILMAITAAKGLGG